jgi:hypothetical protein
MEKESINQISIDFNLTENSIDSPNSNVLAIRTLILSNLFRVTNRNAERKHFRSNTIATFNNESSMTYTGEELRSDDEDFFMYCLEKARDQNIGEHNQYTVELSHYEIIKDLKWDTSSKGYKRLDETISRLVATSMNVTFANTNFDKLPLLRKAKQRDNNKRSKTIKIFFEAEIFNLFTHSKGAMLDYEIRQQLTPLAKKVQSLLMFESASICSEKLETIHKISGSSAKLESFRRQVLAVKKQLLQHGLISHMSIDKAGFVHFHKP